MQDIIEKARDIRLVIFDVDGVLTDGSLFIGDGGEEYKAFNSRDGHGMKMLQKSGVDIGIITGRTSDVVRHRMDSLVELNAADGATTTATAAQTASLDANEASLNANAQARG